MVNVCQGTSLSWILSIDLQTAYAGENCPDSKYSLLVSLLKDCLEDFYPDHSYTWNFKSPDGIIWPNIYITICGDICWESCSLFRVFYLVALPISRVFFFFDILFWRDLEMDTNLSEVMFSGLSSCRTTLVNLLLLKSNPKKLCPGAYTYIHWFNSFWFQDLLSFIISQWFNKSSFFWGFVLNILIFGHYFSVWIFWISSFLANPIGGNFSF